jgi:DNA-binding LytR/AlgR family response regulator
LRILIVEDELPIANYLESLLNESPSFSKPQIFVKQTLSRALEFIKEHSIDLCFLDLNLNGKDGFELLKEVTSYSFHTIVVSANVHRAIDAFDFGVLDFVSKPFEKDRIELALSRFLDQNSKNNKQLKFLSFRKMGQIKTLPVVDVKYIQGAGNYCDVHTINGKMEVVDKSLERLSQLLPEQFFRVHRSYIINLELVDSALHSGGGKYEVNLKSGEVIPVSRSLYKSLQQILGY